VPGLRTISSSEMRSINKSAILDLIRKEGPVSRTAIGKQLKVSLPTVMRVTDALVDEGLVCADPATEWTGGRRRPLLRLDFDANAVVGVELKGTHLFGAVSNLGGRTLEEVRLPNPGRTAEERYACLVDMVKSLLGNPGLSGKHVRGIGIGAPGVTLHQDGVVTQGAGLGWPDYPMRDRLTRDLGLPVTVENDINLAALGELWFGAGQACTNMALISIGAGIGAGIVIDGMLYRGSHEAAGEVGYLLPDRSHLGREYGAFGALETLASGRGIVERSRRLLQEMNVPDGPTLNGAEEVFQAARVGQKWALEIVNETVDYLAILVGAIASIVDPEVIILHGGVSRSSDLLLEPIMMRLARAIPVPPRLVKSELGQRAVALGAVASVIRFTSDYTVAHEWT